MKDNRRLKGNMRKAIGKLITWLINDWENLDFIEHWFEEDTEKATFTITGYWKKNVGDKKT